MWLSGCVPRPPKIGYPAKSTRETLLSTEEGDSRLIKYSKRLTKLRIPTGNNMNVDPYTAKT